MKYNYSTSDKETIFGLSPADLTTEQLKKVVPNKLIDFLYDSRVEDILVENLNSYVIDSESDIRIDLHWLACFEESEWSKFKKIKRAYLDLCDRTNLFSAVRNATYVDSILRLRLPMLTLPRSVSLILTSPAEL
jgi:hypothetical protein